MINSQTRTTIAPGHEPIPGYVLEELIGRGGYGEVWRAEAPGGMKKAVKFVFGQAGGNRTEQELKSLERIKAVQHPFILGLERFEIVDGQLVVVTELANGSLEDVYRKHTDRGSCGIPRGALLSYMRDTAEALDYMHQRYQLQHLDIKPANLLIVGGRVKVADFGLLKDLQSVDVSAVGGLTPLYAPPEVFDGKPNVHSDQYSMAVMFQELLTGVRPFTGRTIAQLATQHVHNTPNLDPLPPRDRPVIARALEKTPDRRFQSCSEFVDSLKDSNAQRAKGSGENQPASDTAEISSSHIGASQPAAVRDLPELKSGAVGEMSTSHHHALVLAIGGIASECVGKLYARINEEGDTRKPDIHTVFIDTSESTVAAVRQIKESNQQSKIRSIETPLKTREEYRVRDVASIRSISRRWIYNIPRSGATEGVRPLGRLALIDHWPEVSEQIEAAVSDLKARCGGKTPRVYVVGSLSGGTSSGMYLDIVHTLRHLLDQAGLADARLISLLASCPLTQDASRPLAVHDTHASLVEIRHFMQPENGFPGDEAAGIPSVPAARTPLNDIYLFVASQSPTAPKPADTLADYLWFDVTCGAELLDAARGSSEPSWGTAGAKGFLRSAGIAGLESISSYADTVLVPVATGKLLRRWLGNLNQAERVASDFVKATQAKLRLSAKDQHVAVMATFAENEESRNEKVQASLKHCAVMRRSEKRLWGDLLQWFEQELPIENAESDVQAAVEKLQRDMSKGLRNGSLEIVSAIESLRQLTRDQRGVEIELRHRSETSAKPTLVFDGIKQDHQLEMALALLDAYAYRIAAARANAFCRELGHLEERLSSAAKLLAAAIRLNSSASKDVWTSANSPVQNQLAPLMDSIHRSASSWLVNMVRPDASQTEAAVLLRQVSLAASQAIANASAQSTAEVCEAKCEIEDTLRQTRPSLLACGGQQRLILAAGSAAELQGFASEIQKVRTGALSTVVLESAAPTVIHEAQQIAIDDVIARLSALNRGNTEISDRLTTRTDIEMKR